MMRLVGLSMWFSVLLLAAAPAIAQDAAPPQDDTAPPKDEQTDLVDQAQTKIDDLSESVDQSEQAHDVSAGILWPIYELAERMSFPAFHWVAFMITVTAVISFALQLALGKLIVLAHAGFSLTEILSDGLGLAVSLIGLVLTTQAATENSTFTSSPFAVISATVCGALAGLLFYVWGQRQELQAVEGRKQAKRKKTG